MQTVTFNVKWSTRNHPFDNTVHYPLCTCKCMYMQLFKVCTCTLHVSKMFACVYVYMYDAIGRAICVTGFQVRNEFQLKDDRQWYFLSPLCARVCDLYTHAVCGFWSGRNELWDIAANQPYSVLVQCRYSFLGAHHTQILSLPLFLTFEGIWNQMGPIL